MKPETLHSGLRHRSHPQPKHAGGGRAHGLCARALGYCSLPCKRGGTRGRPGRVAAWVCAHPCATFSSKKVDETGSARETGRRSPDPALAQAFCDLDLEDRAGYDACHGIDDVCMCDGEVLCLFSESESQVGGGT